jgi:small subunit ribosomal protein S4
VATSAIKRYRREIRNILAEIAGTKATEHALKKEESILNSLKRKGMLKEGSGLEDALAMNLENILERRLQTMVHKKGMCNSLKHARQLIVHGHIAVNGRRVTIPSYIVGTEEEKNIDYYGQTPSEKEDRGEEK